ncbi:Nucleotide-binding protein, UspA family [Halapricum desulfuricans]|uniref:Nucleotide-binding protein, UspA family n=1 Tax=Halapricum desulfuricans TaxID=2841257 RepID=A0A897NKP6_9EURY|nr:universal stress protein [Halapricum desulfuricans]QSG12861.1 Nucleotide-binding protein, UspA family [Halapricum desulfuricans]
MSDRPTVLVPIRVLEGESIHDGVPELLADAHVVLLGYHVIPEQTPPGQARMQFEEQATARMDELESLFEDAGATVERRLVFTGEAQKTIDRTIYEHDCLAVLVPDAVVALEDVLVAVRGTVGIDRLARVVSGLFANADADVTLYHVAGESESDADAETLLSGLADRLAESGVDPDRIETRIERDRKPLAAIIEASDTFDAVVMGESDPSLATFVFGMPAEQVAERFLGPVLIVQRERPESE